MKERLPRGQVRRRAGLCKVATLDEIEAQGWSLNPAATSAWPSGRATTSTSRSGWRN